MFTKGYFYGIKSHNSGITNVKIIKKYTDHNSKQIAKMEENKFQVSTVSTQRVYDVQSDGRTDGC